MSSHHHHPSLHNNFFHRAGALSILRTFCLFALYRNIICCLRHSFWITKINDILLDYSSAKVFLMFCQRNWIPTFLQCVSNEMQQKISLKPLLNSFKLNWSCNGANSEDFMVIICILYMADIITFETVRNPFISLAVCVLQ